MNDSGSPRAQRPHDFVAGFCFVATAGLFRKEGSTMSDNRVSDVLAQAFAAEGVDTLFTLMGDANMYWSASMADNQRVRLIHARHEHCCVAMADAYARASGKVGVCSVTCGPGYTQIMTAMTMAARGNASVVVFAGDAPIGASWYIQSIDQAPLALATGAHFVPVRTIDRALDCVREAFYVARVERKPVVLSVPLDLQKEAFPYLPDYTPSTDLVPRPQVLHPDPAIVDEIAAMVAEAERPIVIGGRGATWSGAKASLEALAQESGALLATTLLGKGLFDGNPFALDVAGTFATDLGRELFAESDLAIAAGAALGHYTTEGGYLFPNARVVRIDTQPRGLWQGLRTADLHVQADAKAAAEAIVSRLKEKGISRQGWRSNEIAAKIATGAENPDTKSYTPTPGTLDPRPVVKELDAAVPKDWDIIVAGGHCFSFAMTHLRGRPAGRQASHPDRFRRERLRSSCSDRGRRGAQQRQGLTDRWRRQPLPARPGTRNRAATRHQAIDLHHQRRRLWGGDAQIPGSWRGPHARDPRPWGPCSDSARVRSQRHQGDEPRRV